MHRLAVVLFVIISFSDAYARPEKCDGKERWEVKTTADADAADIDEDPVDTTVARLNKLKKPAEWRARGPRTDGVETSVYVVQAKLIGYLSERDEDRHLVLCSRGKCMVAEIPDPDCVDASARFFDEIGEVRQTFDDRFRRENGTVPKEKLDLDIRVRVTGVGFFDKKHNVTSAADNQIELHPVIAIEFLDEE